MTQTSFLDQLDQPLSRASDPITSHLSAAETLPKLGRLRQAVLTMIRERGSMTAMEAADRCVVRWRGNIESYRKRAGELVRMGLLEECESRRCQITGAMAQTYRVKHG